MPKARFLLHEPKSSLGPLKNTLLVLWHGAGGDVDHSSIVDTAKQFAAQGAFAARARFQYRIEGRRAPDRMPKLILHAAETVQQIRNATFGKRKHRLLLGGRSMGGRVASMMAEEIGADGLVLLSYPLHTPKDPEKMRDAHLYSIKKPMIFVSGDKDNMASLELLRPVIKKLLPHATLAVFAGADHGFRRVAGPDVAAAVSDWATGI